jgi:predicted amidohydrolase
MPRIITVAAAQLGPLQLSDTREVAIQRMIRLLERARVRGVELVVFPELALTTFFPRHYREGEHALARHGAAVRGRAQIRHRLSPGLCRDRP